MVVTKEFLKSRNVIDIGSIPIYSEDYKYESNNFTQKKFENTISPEVPSTLQQELKSWHEKLFHLYPKYMFRLANLESSHKDLYT